MQWAKKLWTETKGAPQKTGQTGGTQSPPAFGVVWEPLNRGFVPYGPQLPDYFSLCQITAGSLNNLDLEKKIKVRQERM